MASKSLFWEKLEDILIFFCAALSGIVAAARTSYRNLYLCVLLIVNSALQMLFNLKFRAWKLLANVC